MAVIKVRNQPVDIDIETELQSFNWTRPKWSSDKLIAASPFRYDKTPSFFIKLAGEYAGCWGDSGAYDAEWASGNLVKLLSFLRNETYEETEDYLLGTYGYQDDSETVRLAPIKLRTQRDRQTLSTDFLEQYEPIFNYLQSRGISEGVQRQMGVRYDRKSRAVVIPWGRATVKFRTDYGKTFWYYRGGEPIRNLVYGIERAGPTAVLCEAEIDAMSFMEAGYTAVAVGGASFNDVKRDVILRSPIEELIIATDNDKVGGKLRTEIEQSLRGYLRIRVAKLPGDVKDANEALVKYGSAALRQAVEQSVGFGFRTYLRT
ncbi:MAG: toprim domain-containing protein [Bacillota bacterium]